MIRVICVRHGETEWNIAHRLQGRSAVDLAPSGLEQARAAGVYVRGQHPTAGYVSPLSRTRATFDAFGLDVEPKELADLVEQSLGDWEGRKTAAVRDDDGERYRAWKRGEGAPPHGEPTDAVVERMTRAFCGIVRSAAELPATPSVDSGQDLRTVVLVSHGTATKALLEGLGLAERSQVISLTAGAISVVDVPLHDGPLSSSLPGGGAAVAGGAEAEAELIRGLGDAQIRSRARLRMYNLSPEVLAAAGGAAEASG